MCTLFAGLVTVYFSDPCGSWKFYGTSCYHFSGSPVTWYTANESCQSENAFLVTIHDFEENEFVRNISAENDFWIGLNDISQEGHFVWLSNSNASYLRWGDGEPNDVGGEDCAHMIHSSTYWNDQPCNYPSPYVCEKGENSFVVK